MTGEPHSPYISATRNTRREKSALPLCVCKPATLAERHSARLSKLQKIMMSRGLLALQKRKRSTHLHHIMTIVLDLPEHRPDAQNMN